MITKWLPPLLLGTISILISAQNAYPQSKQGPKSFPEASQTNKIPTNTQPSSSLKNEANLQTLTQQPKDIEGNEKLVSQWNNTLDETKKQVNAGNEDFSLFIRFYQSYIDSERCALFHLVNSGEINDNNIAPYISGKKQKLLSLYSHFLQVKKEFPTSVEQYRKSAPVTIDTCFPSCTNIDFNTGDFTGWSGYYAINNSVTNYNITTTTGGLLGSVVKGALDPFTANSYQVHITSKANPDWFLSTYHGINMSQASPWGGNFSAMIGDSINNGAGVAVLSQKFFVSPGTTNFTYQYAVFLENPNHPVFEQPFFKVALLDQNGDTIPYCGQYVVVSRATIPGFKGEYYPPRNDTIYWKDWTQVNVPLSKYVGQCITVIFEVADCEPTGHCGYAYVDASCSPLAISMPAPMLCGKNSGTLVGPAGAAQYLWTGPANSIIGSDTLQNVNVDSAGTYTLVITPVTGAQCKDTLTIKIAKYPGVKLTATAVNVLCNGGNTGSITASPSGGMGAYTYSWSPLVGTSATASGLSAGKYMVMVTDSFGCSITDTITLTQPALLTAAATSANIHCGGANNGSANATVVGGTTPYTYLWNPSGQTNASATGLSAGNYTVTVTDANGCAASATTTITQPPAFTASASGTNLSCNGDSSGIIIIVPNGGKGPYKYLWAPCGCTEDTIYGAKANAYSVVVTDANGCTATGAVTITQPLALIASTPITTNVSCNGANNGSANITVTGGTSVYKYLWSPSAQTNAAATGLSAGNYTVTITDAHGCNTIATATITEPAVLNATTTSTNINCNGNNNGSINVAVSGGTIPYNYLWSCGNTTASVGSLSPGTFTVTVTDANGCISTASTTITQPPVLTATAATLNNVNCNAGINGSASVNASGGTIPYTYLWMPSSQYTATASGLSAGSYSVTVTDAHGCANINTVTITQPPSLSVFVNSSQQSICNGQSVKIHAVTSGGTAPYAYLWSNGNTSSILTVIPPNTITYTVTITDANGCTTIGTVTIAVNPPIIAKIQVASVCPGQSATLSVSASGGDGTYTYNWMPGGNTTQTLTLTPASTTTYTVIISDGCSKSDTVYETAVVNPLPDVAFGADNTQGCAPLCVQFRNNSKIGSGNIVQWDWNFGDGSISNDANPIHCYANPGKYTVLLTATAASGCSAGLTKVSYITVYSSPTAAFTANPQPTDINNPLIRFTDQSSDKDGITSWAWAFGEPGDSNSSYIQNPYHRYKDTGTYKANLIVVNVHGCVDSVTHDVVIAPDFTLYFPNAFSPNSDGTNDIFTAKGSYVKDFEMYIYDRWGMKLYHTTDIDKGWNGMAEGGNTMCQEDTYVYVATAEDTRGNKHQYMGKVTLIK